MDTKALDKLVDHEEEYCWMFGEHKNDPCPCGWSYIHSVKYQLEAIKKELAEAIELLKESEKAYTRDNVREFLQRIGVI